MAVLRGSPHRYPPRAPIMAHSSSLSQTIPDTTTGIYSANGAVFAVLGGGHYARCSGTSVNSPNLSLVFTAGHCINTGGFQGYWLKRKWVFVPGYHDGQRPFGTFAAKWLAVPPQWLATKSENFDVGVAVVYRNDFGQRLVPAVGGDGITWGQNPNQVFDVYGYPVAPPFTGATQQVCLQTSYEGYDDASYSQPGPLNLAVECNITEGASGGGWIIPGDLLNSVTDYYYPSDPMTDYGSYFGNAIGSLYMRAGKWR